MSGNRKEKELTRRSFDELLAWLDRDRQRAGRKYEEIRSALVRIFVCQGCAAPEDLADKTIDRVIGKVPEIAPTYVGNPALYFSAVARFILIEYKQRNAEASLTIDPAENAEEEDIEPEYECLDKCLQKLTSKNRDLILGYYQGEGQAKIDNRRELAERLGLSLNALRVRADRIRASLEECVNRCLDKNM